MRYGLNAAIIAGVFCFAPGESARTMGDRGGANLPGSLPGLDEMTPPAGLYLEDYLYFYDGRTKGGVKLRPGGRRVAWNFLDRPCRCRPVEVTPS
jgi:hypothetical protein